MGLAPFLATSNAPHGVTRWDLMLPFHFLISHVSQIPFHSPVSNRINGSLPSPLYKSPHLSFSSSGKKNGACLLLCLSPPYRALHPPLPVQGKRTKRWRMRLPDPRVLYLIPPFLFPLSHYGARRPGRWISRGFHRDELLLSPFFFLSPFLLVFHGGAV